MAGRSNFSKVQNFLQLMSLKVIYFQSIFLIDFYLKKIDLCAEMLNKSQNCYATGNSRER